MCVSKLTIVGWDNGLSPGWREAIIWTNAGILLIRRLGTNCDEIWIIFFIFFSFIRENAFENDRKLAAIFVLPSVHIENYETLSMNVQTWHHLIYVYHWIHDCIANGKTRVTCSCILHIYSFPIPPTNLCCHKRGYYCALWIEYEWRDI